jgi:hypothetical protein
MRSKKIEIGTAVNDKHSDRSEGMDRRVDIVETPFVRRERAIRMQKPFPQQHQQLVFRKRRI